MYTSTLIALLKGVSFNWQQDKLAKNIKEIAITFSRITKKNFKVFDTLKE